MHGGSNVTSFVATRHLPGNHDNRVCSSMVSRSNAVSFSGMYFKNLSPAITHSTCEINPRQTVGSLPNHYFSRKPDVMDLQRTFHFKLSQFQDHLMQMRRGKEEDPL